MRRESRLRHDTAGDNVGAMRGKTFLHYLRVLCAMDMPQTQTSDTERDLLKKYLPGMKRIVEIGVFEGFTTRMLAESSDPDATIYGVDPFFRGRLSVSWGLQIAKSHLRPHLASGKVKLVRTYSTQVANTVPSSVDYVFIDADHALDAIAADWAFWSNRLRPGGIIALHDVLLPTNKPQAVEFGSHQYFRTHVRNDRRFETIDQHDSLAVLRKI